MIRAHKIRLNPTAEQAEYFLRAAGTARFAFNWGLAHWTKAQEIGQHVSVRALSRAFHTAASEQFPWVQESAKSVVEGAFMDLGRAVSRCQDAQARGVQTTLPRFNSKKRSKPSFYLASGQFNVGDHWVDIPGIGRVNMAEKLRFAGNVRSARISKRAETWFVSIVVDLSEAPQFNMNRTPGWDNWLNWLSTFGDGWRFENQETLVYLLKRAQRMSRNLNRKQKGSKNYEKARLRLTRLNERVLATRDDLFNKFNAAMVRSRELGAFEDMHVMEMVMNHPWTRAMQAAGDRVQQVGRFFPSSKRCSVCHALRKETTLADGVFVCSRCGFEADPQVNDSLNMIQEALRFK